MKKKKNKMEALMEKHNRQLLDITNKLIASQSKNNNPPNNELNLGDLMSVSRQRRNKKLTKAQLEALAEGRKKLAEMRPKRKE